MTTSLGIALADYWALMYFSVVALLGVAASWGMLL